MLSPVSTWMGDRLGTQGAAESLHYFYFGAINQQFFYGAIMLQPNKGPFIRVERSQLVFLSLSQPARPYHIEYTSSRLITEVKQCWALLVLGWVTAWEHRVLLASSLFLLWCNKPTVFYNAKINQTALSEWKETTRILVSFSASGHITLNIPVLVWSLKSSNVEPC